MPVVSAYRAFQGLQWVNGSVREDEAGVAELQAILREHVLGLYEREPHALRTLTALHKTS